jgi:hypothetical protein
MRIIVDPPAPQAECGGWPWAVFRCRRLVVPRSRKPMMLARTQDDTPSVSISNLVASGAVRKDMPYARVSIEGFTRTFRLTRRELRNNGWWMFFICGCGRRARVLRLSTHGIACPRCTRGYAGLRYRVECLSKPKRAAQRIARLEALLSGGPARLHPRPGRTVDRRSRLEVSLRRAKVVIRSQTLRGSPVKD